MAKKSTKPTMAALFCGGEEPYPSIDDLLALQRLQGLDELTRVADALEQKKTTLSAVDRMKFGVQLPETAQDLRDFVEVVSDILLQHDIETKPDIYAKAKTAAPFHGLKSHALQEIKELTQLENLTLSLCRAKALLGDSFPSVDNVTAALGIRLEGKATPVARGF